MSSNRVGRARSAASGWRWMKQCRSIASAAIGSSHTWSIAKVCRASARTASYDVWTGPRHQTSTSRSEWSSHPPVTAEPLTTTTCSEGTCVGRVVRKSIQSAYLLRSAVMQRSMEEGEYAGRVQKQLVLRQPR